MYFRKLLILFKINVNCFVKYVLVMVFIFGNFFFINIFNSVFCCYLGIQDVYGNYFINVFYVYLKIIIYVGVKIIYKYKSMRYKDVFEICGLINEVFRVVVGF